MFRIYSATLWGLQPIKVEVEVDSHRGIPGLHIIGLPNKTVGEAKERIISALYKCGVKPKSKRVIVNLAPADVPKKSSHLELAIAVGLLKLFGQISMPTDSTFFCGELSLNGSLRPIRGALPLTLAAKKMGFSQIILPESNKNEVAIIKGITVTPLSHLSEYLAFTNQGTPLPVLSAKKFRMSETDSHPTFFDIKGQELPKRAITLTAAGGHNVLMIGPPGSGKSLLAQSLTDILPPLAEEEAIEVTHIYSAFGLNNQKLITHRPFRSPHHSISTTGLLGGGSHLRPGEISLAHKGILFLDELLEFKRSALEALRTPLEEHHIQLNRAEGQVTYPASFSLVAATNPCHCGYAGTQEKECHCSAKEIANYRQKLSGPLTDRIDLKVWVSHQKMSKLKSVTTHNLTQIRQQIRNVRQLQQQRYQSHAFTLNHELPSSLLKKFCPLDTEAETFLIKASDQLKLSLRSYDKVIRLARTIADFESEAEIRLPHIAEALQFRLEESYA